MLQRSNIYSTVNDIIFILSTVIDLKHVYCISVFFRLAQMSVFSLLTQIIKSDYVKLIIDFRFPSGKHIAHVKGSIIN